jgi:hypothetical protein
MTVGFALLAGGAIAAYAGVNDISPARAIMALFGNPVNPRNAPAAPNDPRQPAGVNVALTSTDGRSEWAGLTPAMQSALAQAESMLGRRIPISSGYRSPAQQQNLWDHRASNPYPVARPGTSKHESGEAVDVPLSFRPTLAHVAPAVGLCQPVAGDPVHWELCR